MIPPSPYGPDRSLPIAVALLVGGGLFAAAAVYLLTTSAETFTGPHRAHLTKGQAQHHAWAGARRSVRRSAPAARLGKGLGRTPFATPAPGRVPAWAGSGTSFSPPRSPGQEMYNLRPDMSHADLGPPPDGPGFGIAGAGTAGARGEPPTGGVPEAGGAPLTVDLGTGSSGEGTTWRSSASRLENRARALSGALAQLDRSRSAASGRTRTNGPSGDASTAAADRGSPAVANPPDPPPPPPEVPVDGGLGWLAAAGAAYAANRLRKQQDAGESDDEA